MQFLVTGIDATDHEAPDRRKRAREAHLRLGDEMVERKTLLFGVAHLDETGTMRGSTMVVEFPSRDELNRWLEIEPYVTEHVWEHVNIIPCQVGPRFQRR